MSFFNYRWDKCHFLTIGGTYVDLIEGGTNVGGTNVGWTNVGGRKVAASVIVIIQFMLSVYFCSKVITFSGFDCITNGIGSQMKITIKKVTVKE
jgi:hypothetical protein